MSALTNMLKELRERKLWPIAIGLIVALVAVPVLLSKNAPTNLITPVPSGALPYSTGTTLPAISVQTTPASVKLAGRGRDPFTPQHAAVTTTAAVVATVSTSSTPAGAAASTGSTTTASSGAGSSAAGSSTTSSSAGSGSTSAPAPSIPAPSTPAKPAPSGLAANQAYQVSLAITTPSGGLNTIDSLTRLSILPNPQQPLLIELGALQGGNSVLFAVQRGAVVSGPGTCTPGPIDCQILSLAPGQTEGLSTQTSTGGTSSVALFQVTAITAHDFGSAGQASQARQAASAQGRKLLSQAGLNAVSLFQYVPSIGAIVDLRNLTVGGS